MKINEIKTFENLDLYLLHLVPQVKRSGWPSRKIWGELSQRTQRIQGVIPKNELNIIINELNKLEKGLNEKEKTKN